VRVPVAGVTLRVTSKTLSFARVRVTIAPRNLGMTEDNGLKWLNVVIVIPILA
jgi:hypothetical protein